MGEIFLGVVADDFTGASDAASFLVEAGVPTVLFNGIPQQCPKLSDQTRAIVVALKSRTEEPQKAVSESLDAFAWLKTMGAEKLYLKYCSTFDSTDQGNIGPVIDAVMERYALTRTVLCPALPVNGRTVRDGKLYVNGVLLEESPMKDHPLTPMRKSRIADLMRVQGKYPCREISAETMQRMLAGGEAMNLSAGDENSNIYLVPDYYEEEHADQIAQLFGDLPFLTGGSGLVGALGRRYVRLSKAAGTDDASEEGQKKTEALRTGEDKKSAAERRDKAWGKAVLLAGSCSAVTLKQIETYQKTGNPSFVIEPEKLFDGRQSVDSIWEWIQTEGRDGLIYSSADPEGLKKSQQLGRERVAAKIEETLSNLAQRAEREGYTRFIIAGGETSGAVTKALGFAAFYIGPSVAPGVPVMTPLENTNVRLVLKSGNFGQPDFFERAKEMTKQ
ncbi:four-carbon acid sugar kinase family protein [Brotaphodocola sp.]|uniref:four-carbon acid sugar kinase family protein n=1 Tax=Brotaphodocola sp. TaxID=3073577 RepID=UPI003D7CA63E